LAPTIGETMDTYRHLFPDDDDAGRPSTGRLRLTCPQCPEAAEH
jgi:hypothetical protein